MARIRMKKSGNKTLKFEITDKEVVQFQKRMKDFWIWKRAEIIRLASIGYNNHEIEEITGINEKNVRSWINRFNDEGFDGLLRRISNIHRGELTKEQIEELKSNLKKAPTDFGFNTYSWTAKLVWKHVENEFGVKYHRRHIYRLITRIGYKLGKPYVINKKQSEEEVEKFYHKIIPDTLKKTKI